MASNLQTLIRSIPDCIDGQGAADFCASVAKQVKEQAPGLDTASSWWDFGEGTKVYSTERILAAANELDLYGDSLRYKSGPFCRASEERNRIITLLGNVDGLVGARIAVNATLSQAQSQLAEDLGDNIKAAFDYTKWLVLAAVVIAVAVAIAKWKS